MELLGSFLIGVVGFAVGFFAGGYLAVQPALILFLGIPFARKAMSAGLITSRTPLNTYILSFIVLSLIFVLLSAAFLLFLPKAFFIGYLGAVIFLLTDAFQSRIRNEASLQDVTRALGPHVPEEKYGEYADFALTYFTKP
jgi:hypothetical protein